MVFVGEQQQLGFYAAHAGRGKGAFGLGVLYAEIALSVDAEDGSIPTIHIEVGEVA